MGGGWASRAVANGTDAATFWLADRVRRLSVRAADKRDHNEWSRTRKARLRFNLFGG